MQVKNSSTSYPLNFYISSYRMAKMQICDTKETLTLLTWLFWNDMQQHVLEKYIFLGNIFIEWQMAT
jgi:hypothetical protein